MPIDAELKSQIINFSSGVSSINITSTDNFKQICSAVSDTTIYNQYLKQYVDSFLVKYLFFKNDTIQQTSELNTWIAYDIFPYTINDMTNGGIEKRYYREFVRSSFTNLQQKSFSSIEYTRLNIYLDLLIYDIDDLIPKIVQYRDETVGELSAYQQSSHLIGVKSLGLEIPQSVYLLFICVLIAIFDLLFMYYLIVENKIQSINGEKLTSKLPFENFNSPIKDGIPFYLSNLFRISFYLVPVLLNAFGYFYKYDILNIYSNSSTFDIILYRNNSIIDTLYDIISCISLVTVIFVLIECNSLQNNQIRLYTWLKYHISRNTWKVTVLFIIFGSVFSMSALFIGQNISPISSLSYYYNYSTFTLLNIFLLIYSIYRKSRLGIVVTVAFMIINIIFFFL